MIKKIKNYNEARNTVEPIRCHQCDVDFTIKFFIYTYIFLVVQLCKTRSREKHARKIHRRVKEICSSLCDFLAVCVTAFNFNKCVLASGICTCKPTKSECLLLPDQCEKAGCTPVEAALVLLGASCVRLFHYVLFMTLRESR